MSQQKQHQHPTTMESSEIHTIQIFREADTIRPSQTYQPHYSSSPIESKRQVLSVPYFEKELHGMNQQQPQWQDNEDDDDGIGGDWAIEMDANVEDAVLDAVPSQARRGSDSTLYSFYFEAPSPGVQPSTGMQEDSEDDHDDFTITSEDSASFHNNTDLQLDILQDSTSFWETGLVTTTTNNDSALQQLSFCASPAHVSLTGEDQQPSTAFPMNM